MNTAAHPPAGRPGAPSPPFRARRGKPGRWSRRPDGQSRYRPTSWPGAPGRPGAQEPELPLMGYSINPFAIAIHGEHLGGPALQPGIVLLQPGVVLAATHVVRGGDQQRRIGIQEIVRHVVLDSRHAVCLHPAQVAVQRLADHVQRGQARRQRRRAHRHGGVLKEREGAGVAGGMVGQHAQAGVQLKDFSQLRRKPSKRGSRASSGGPG